MVTTVPALVRLGCPRAAECRGGAEREPDRAKHQELFNVEQHRLNKDRPGSIIRWLRAFEQLLMFSVSGLWSALAFSWNFSWISPIPIHCRKLCSRGFSPRSLSEHYVHKPARNAG